jgi:hypothetical protein
VPYKSYPSLVTALPKGGRHSATLRLHNRRRPIRRPVENEKVALQNIENREQEHPHDINKVPIKAGTLEEPMLLGRDVPGERSD